MKKSEHILKNFHSRILTLFGFICGAFSYIGYESNPNKIRQEEIWDERNNDFDVNKFTRPAGDNEFTINEERNNNFDVNKFTRPAGDNDFTINEERNNDFDVNKFTRPAGDNEFTINEERNNDFDVNKFTRPAGDNDFTISERTDLSEIKRKVENNIETYLEEGARIAAEIVAARKRNKKPSFYIFLVTLFCFSYSSNQEGTKLFWK